MDNLHWSLILNKTLAYTISLITAGIPAMGSGWLRFVLC